MIKRTTSSLLFFLLITLLAACTQRTAPPQVPEQPPGPGAALFEEAETLYSLEKWDQALSAYARYVAEYPKQPGADSALWRIGSIYQRIGQAEAAEAFFLRVLNEYPQSSHAAQASLALVDMWLAAGRTDEALQLAERMLKADVDEESRRKAWLRLADVYRRKNETTKAALLEYQLYKSAPESQKQAWADQLIQTLESLSAEQIAGIWDEIDDEALRAAMMYRYAIAQATQENYDDALDILNAFQKAYPHDIHAHEAAQLVETLTRKLTFQPYVLGCLLPLSGPYQNYGTQALNGIQLALSLVQKGETQAPIKLIVKDTASDDARAVQGVRELAEAGVGAILGPIVTAPAAAREAQRLQIPMVTFTQKPEITAIGDFIFRHFITPQNQVQILVDYFINQLGLRDFAILYPQEAYGQTFMTLFWDEVVRRGGQVVGVESYDKEQTDFAEPIKKLCGKQFSVPDDLQARSAVRVDANPYFEDAANDTSSLNGLLSDPLRRLTGLYHLDPDQDLERRASNGRPREDDEEMQAGIVDFDVLFIPDEPKKSGLIIPQLVYYDIHDIYLAGTNLWHSPQLIDMAKDYLKNAVMVDGFFKDSQSEPVRRFVEVYQQTFGADPGIIEAFAFDTAMLMFELLEQPQMQLRHTLRDALREVYFSQGVTGPTAFAQNGEAIKRLSLLRVKGGQFVEMKQP